MSTGRHPAGASASRRPGHRAAALVTAALAMVAGFLLAGAGGAAAVDGTSGPASTWISLIPATSSAIAPDPVDAEPLRSAESSAAREPVSRHGAKRARGTERSMIAPAGMSAGAAGQDGGAGGDGGARGAGAADGAVGGDGGARGAAAAEPEAAPGVPAVGVGSSDPWLLAAMAAAVLIAGGGIVLRLRRARQH